MADPILQEMAEEKGLSIPTTGARANGSKPPDGPSLWDGPHPIFTGDKGTTWRPRNAAENLRETGLAAAKGGGELYLFERGRYVEGEGKLRDLLAQQLAEHWRPGRADDVARYLYDTGPNLWARPPFDRVNVANGLLDMATGELRPHDPEFLSPVQIPIKFDPVAECPKIDAFIEAVFPNDSLMLAYEWLGLLLLPDTVFQRALLLLGEGENGKSVFLNLATALVGFENTSTRTLQEVAEDRFAAADLYGKLANISADIPGSALRQVDMFKRLTGEDEVTVQRKYRDAFKVRPYARLLFSGQEVPPSPDSSHAYRRRWSVLRFPHTFNGKQCPACGDTHARDERLIARLTSPDELSGLLNRALVAYADLRERGAFSETESTKAGAQELDEAIDDTAGFIEESCIVEEAARVDRASLYRAYRKWCEDNGQRPAQNRRFNTRIKRRGFELRPYAGRPTWHRLGLLSEVSP